MRQHSLSEKGLSMSEAQSISNLCNQRALDITNHLKNVNIASKTILIGAVTHTLQKAIVMPVNVIEMLEEKGLLTGCQAFLMENIKAKERLLMAAKNEQPNLNVVETVIRPMYAMSHMLNSVTEEWGWEQLSIKEMNEYYQVEALAAHIGQFIHKGSTLEKLRDELNKLPSIEWIDIVAGTKSPVVINANHSAEELQTLHEKLSEIHRKHEQRTNYFKAKVKTMVTTENARIARINADETIRVNDTNKVLNTAYNEEVRDYNDVCSKIESAFEIERQETIKKLAVLRIAVDPLFQPIIDKFLVKPVTPTV